MSRCISLAEKGLGHVSPNPMVGCVIVHQDNIIGEGWHRQYGMAHAEVNAIAQAEANHSSDILKNSTLYVSLEPCAHFGKTPPCADLIISKQIPRVVIGCTDSYKDVNGRGAQKLKDAGIDVVIGVMETACRELNRRFFTFHEKNRPYIILKWAESTDGFMAPASGERIQISGYDAQLLLHRWRTEEDAFMIGHNTLLRDNPQLTSRLWEGRSPIRIAIDKNLQAPHQLNFFDNTAETLIFHSSEITAAYPQHIRLEKMRDGFGVHDMLATLKSSGIQSVVVEGGPTLLQSFIADNMWDEARVFRSKTVLLSDGLKSPVLTGTAALNLNLQHDTLSIIRNPLSLAL